MRTQLMALVGCLFLVFWPISNVLAQGQVLVRVLGIDTDQGVIRYGLFNSEKSFPDDDQAFLTGSQAVQSKGCEFLIPNLPAGDYAIAMAHDVNDNGEVDRFLLIPTEPVGVSGYSSRLWAPPDWSKAAFSVGDELLVVEVSVF